MGKNRPLEEFLRVQTVFEEFVLSDKPAVERIRLRGGSDFTLQVFELNEICSLSQCNESCALGS